jgi:hypothetical protein
MYLLTVKKVLGLLLALGDIALCAYDLQLSTVKVGGISCQFRCLVATEQ